MDDTEIETKPVTPRIELPPLPADAVPIVATRNLVLFPGIVLPVALGREESIAAAQEAVRTGRKIGLLLQRDPSVEKPTATDLYEYGVLATVVRYVTSPEGSPHLVAQGESRFRMLQIVRETPFLGARIEAITDTDTGSSEMEPPLAALKKR